MANRGTPPRVMKLLSLLGLDARLWRARRAIDEGARAAEDRAQLVRMAWEEDKQRLKLMFALSLAVLGLAILTVAMVSVATVVHFWDTPHRVTAAWFVAGFWTLSWIVAMVWLRAVSQRSSSAFDPARHEFARDWEWLQARMASTHQGDGDPQESGEPRPATVAALQARIAQQRQRIAAAASATPPSGAGGEAAAGSAPRSAAVVELARAHPVIAGVAAAGVVAVLGPRRLVRWAGWLLPLLLRSR